MPTILMGVTWGLSVVVALFVGGYLKSYVSKKGENLATHEDINKLVDQMTAVTTATKEIEAKISSEVWNRQKEWEMKRDVIFATAEKVGVAVGAMERLHATYMTEKQSAETGGIQRPGKKTEVAADWNTAAAQLEATAMIVSASCGEQLRMALLQFALFMRNLALEIMEGQPEAFTKKSKELVEKSHAITQAMRNEISHSSKF